jgi:hypothetical protein
MDMNFSIHIDCKACKERLELVTAPLGHEKHPHFRCKCMPPGGSLCILMKATLAPTVQG